MPVERVRSLDTLRGLMLVIMAVDHLDLYGPIYRLTYETVGFVSAAEGFVLLSGIVAGLVYGGYAEDPRRLAAAVRGRLVTLWRYHLVVVGGLFVSWLVLATGRPQGGVVAAVAQALGGAVLLNQEPPLDILPLYLLFVAVLPVVLGALRRGRAPLVLAVSGAVWLLDQFLAPRSVIPPALHFSLAGAPVFWQANHFHLLAWQFLFVGGTWVGWRTRAARAAGSRPLPTPAIVAALVVAVVCFALRHGIVLAEIPRANVAVARVNLGWLRLANVAAVAVLVSAVARTRPGWFHVPWLERLGRHALLVFTWQTLLQIFLRPFYLEAAARWGFGARVLILAVVVASLSVPIAWRSQRDVRTGTK